MIIPGTPEPTQMLHRNLAAAVDAQRATLLNLAVAEGQASHPLVGRIQMYTNVISLVGMVSENHKYIS